MTGPPEERVTFGVDPEDLVRAIKKLRERPVLCWRCGEDASDSPTLLVKQRPFRAHTICRRCAAKEGK